MPLCLVSLLAINARDIYELFELFYLKITVETFKKTGPAQCHNCAQNLATVPKTAATHLDSWNAQMWKCRKTREKLRHALTVAARTWLTTVVVQHTLKLPTSLSKTGTPRWLKTKTSPQKHSPHLWLHLNLLFKIINKWTTPTQSKTTPPKNFPSSIALLVISSTVPKS